MGRWPPIALRRNSDVIPLKTVQSRKTYLLLDCRFPAFQLEHCGNGSYSPCQGNDQSYSRLQLYVLTSPSWHMEVKGSQGQCHPASFLINSASLHSCSSIQAVPEVHNSVREKNRYKRSALEWFVNPGYSVCLVSLATPVPTVLNHSLLSTLSIPRKILYVWIRSVLICFVLRIKYQNFLTSPWKSNLKVLIFGSLSPRPRYSG